LVAASQAQVVQAYATSELGRSIVRRELTEGARVQPGEQVLVLCENKPRGGIEHVVASAVETLRDLGAQVTIMRVDELIPLSHGIAQGAWSDMEQYTPPAPIFEAMRAADVILDYTTNARGAQKYNEAFHTISSYYGKRMFAYRAVEAPEILSGDPAAPIASPEAVCFPSDLLRLIADRVNDALIGAAEKGEELRLTNPWGTDVRFRALPGDVCIPGGGIRSFPDEVPLGYVGDDGNRLYVALIGCTVTQDCSGVWVTKHCSLLGGELSQPMKVTVRDGFLAGADGGPEAERLMELTADEPCGIHAILIGINHKAPPFRAGEYILENKGAAAGVSHMAFGGPGLYYRNGAWGGLGNKHFQLGDIPKVSLWAGQQCIFQDGVLQTLQHPEVRRAAARFGDPDELLRQFDWPAEV
jgi:hypothetical protein